MDVLSDILNTIRLSGTVYFQSDFAAPWGMAMDESHLAQFHMVVSGECWLQLADDAIRLQAGDMVALLDGAAHQLAAEPDNLCESGLAVLDAHRRQQPLFQGDGICTTLICGHFEFDRSVQHPFVRSLPAMLHVRYDQHLPAVAKQIVRETRANQPGTNLIVDRLADVLFIHLLRAHMLDQKPETGYLAALNEPSIYSALQLIHQSPQTDWTLAALARQVGMSRSSFATHFKTRVGDSPMHYITGWRMQKAHELLKNTNLPLSAISHRVGYTSEAAFSRAFKRQFGDNPGAARKIMQSLY